MVAPKEAEKLAIDSGTPRRRVCASTFSGMEAALERLETVMTTAGQLKQEEWVDFDRLVDNSFAQKAS